MRFVFPKCALIAILAAFVSFPQEIASISPDTAKTTTNIRVNSDLVLIPVTVLDRRDSLVPGLTKEHFKLFEDKVEQTISHFTSEDVPISVGFVFDASSSMSNKLAKSREAVSSFLGIANPDDEFFLVQFYDRVDLVLGMTNNTAELRDRLMWIQPRGHTALLDAIAFSLEQMKHAHNSRKALIIISDGGDNASRYTLGKVKNMIRESDVQIYAIGILEPPNIRSRTPEEMVGPVLLSDIAEQTGGRLFDTEDIDRLPQFASTIGMALRHQYILGYVPASSKHDGKFHHVKLKLEPPKGFPKLHASWRRGYLAPVE